VYLFEHNSQKIFGANDEDTPEDSQLPEIMSSSVLAGFEINVNDVFNH